MLKFVTKFYTAAAHEWSTNPAACIRKGLNKPSPITETEITARTWEDARHKASVIGVRIPNCTCFSLTRINN